MPTLLRKKTGAPATKPADLTPKPSAATVAAPAAPQTGFGIAKRVHGGGIAVVFGPVPTIEKGLSIEGDEGDLLVSVAPDGALTILKEWGRDSDGKGVWIDYAKPGETAVAARPIAPVKGGQQEVVSQKAAEDRFAQWRTRVAQVNWLYNEVLAMVVKHTAETAKAAGYVFSPEDCRTATTTQFIKLGDLYPIDDIPVGMAAEAPKSEAAK